MNVPDFLIYPTLPRSKNGFFRRPSEEERLSGISFVVERARVAGASVLGVVSLEGEEAPRGVMVTCSPEVAKEICGVRGISGGMEMSKEEVQLMNIKIREVAI